MQCTKCGFRIQDNTAQYCPKCGGRLPEQNQFVGMYLGEDQVSFSCVFPEKFLKHKSFAKALGKIISVLKYIHVDVSLIRPVPIQLPLKEFPFICGKCRIYRYPQANMAWHR